MNRTKPNIAMNFKRYLFVLATVLLVFLSSCVVKSSIKTLVGIPTNTAQSFAKGHLDFSVTNLDRCAEIDLADAQIIQKSSFDVQDLLPVVIFTVSFLFMLCVLFPASKENKHPLYSGSRKIRNSIPIFLEYRKLIIYFSH
jgi:hypothetical protein